MIPLHRKFYVVLTDPGVIAVLHPSYVVTPRRLCQTDNLSLKIGSMAWFFNGPAMMVPNALSDQQRFAAANPPTA